MKITPTDLDIRWGVLYFIQKIVSFISALKYVYLFTGVFRKKLHNLRSALVIIAFYKLRKLLILLIFHPGHIRTRLSHSPSYPVKTNINRIVKKDDRVAGLHSQTKIR